MYDKLIHPDTGEFDWTFIKRQALVRAQGRWGSGAPPTSYVRNELHDLKDTARIIRKRWREANGLPDDTVYVSMAIPAWGASGDSFGAGR